jgi:hypothetical protein
MQKIDKRYAWYKIETRHHGYSVLVLETRQDDKTNVDHY